MTQHALRFDVYDATSTQSDVDLLSQQGVRRVYRRVEVDPDDDGELAAVV
jgi:hypothetical protein